VLFVWMRYPVILFHLPGTLCTQVEFQLDNSNLSDLDVSAQPLFMQTNNKYRNDTLFITKYNST